MALETFEVQKELILQHKTTRKQVRYRVTTYELGFYIRIEYKDFTDTNWYLEDITTRNQPQKVTLLITKAIEKYKAMDYRVVKDELMKVKRDPKVYKYIV